MTIFDCDKPLAGNKADKPHSSGCVCGVLNSYFRVRLQETTDTMRVTASVIITSVIEINVGIIVGCMPYLSPIMRTGILGIVKVCSLTHIRSIFTEHMPFLRTSHKFANEATEHPANASALGSDRNAYLETQMLGSVDGKGKFLQSGNFPQKSWLHRSALHSHGGGEIVTSIYTNGNETMVV